MLVNTFPSLSTNVIKLSTSFLLISRVSKDGLVEVRIPGVMGSSCPKADLTFPLKYPGSPAFNGSSATVMFSIDLLLGSCKSALYRSAASFVFLRNSRSADVPNITPKPAPNKAGVVICLSICSPLKSEPKVAWMPNSMAPNVAPKAAFEAVFCTTAAAAVL